MMDADRYLGPYVAIYSQDGFGLGHMRRTSSIASQLLRTCPGAGILTLSDSQLGRFFESNPNHDYIKLPSVVKVGPGNWKAVNLPLPFAKVQAIRQELIRCTLLNFQPDILLVDHMPHGAMGELIPALDALKEAGIGTKVVLGLRDILDAPEVVESRWRAEGAFETLERYYDRVLVYGMQDVFDLTEEYQFSEKITGLTTYCGYVCTPATARYAGRARAQSLNGAGEKAKLIVAMAGGGADAYPMMSTLLDALPAVLAQQRCALMMITGPFMPTDLRHNLETRARGLPVRVRISVSDSLSYIDAADLIVAMAGYNTTIEILRSGKRAILIPRAGPSAEQRTRARLFAARHWIEMIDPDNLSRERISQTILDNLQSGQKSRKNQPSLDGINTTVNHLLSLLPEETRVCTGIQTMLAELRMPVQ